MSSSARVTIGLILSFWSSVSFNCVARRCSITGVIWPNARVGLFGGRLWAAGGWVATGFAGWFARRASRSAQRRPAERAVKKPPKTAPATNTPTNARMTFHGLPMLVAQIDHRRQGIVRGRGDFVFDRRRGIAQQRAELGVVQGHARQREQAR